MLSKFTRKLVQRYNYLKTKETLYKLSDKELQDIGINRSMIPCISQENTII